MEDPPDFKSSLMFMTPGNKLMADNSAELPMPCSSSDFKSRLIFGTSANSAKQPLLPQILDLPNSAEQPLLPEILDLPQRKLNLHRSRTMPAILQCEPPVPDLDFKFPFPIRRRRRFILLYLIIIYIGVGVVCFYFAKDQLEGKKTNGILDAIYFCIVTITTVSYGDLVPDSATAKLVACAFVLIGMAIGVDILSKAADYILEMHEMSVYIALQKSSKDGKERMSKEIETLEYKFNMSAVFLTVLIVTGTIFLLEVEKLNVVDTFNCVWSTFMPVGYGDKCFSTTGGRVFAVFWIMTSTICVALFVLCIAELKTKRREYQIEKWILQRDMTVSEFLAADLDNSGAVEVAEFVIYKLKEMGKITEADILRVMQMFQRLDTNNKGKLRLSDLA